MPLMPKECRRTTGITKSSPGLSHLVVLRFFHCLLLADSQHLTSHADHVVATNDRHISESFRYAHGVTGPAPFPPQPPFSLTVAPLAAAPDGCTVACVRVQKYGFRIEKTIQQQH